jgi:hypothetical protein
MQDDSLSDPQFISRSYRSVDNLKKIIWLYFWLLIFEGAVRKWIPSLASLFFLIRDPVALIIWIQGSRHGSVPMAYWTIFYPLAFGLTLFGLLQIIIDGLPPAVFLFGWRSYVLHVPAILIIGSILNAKDLRKLGKWILLLSPCMSILMFAQYLSSSDSWLNRGATGVDSGQIAAALGHIRPAGTFSFITGPAAFYPVVAAFVLVGIAKRGLYPRYLIVSSGIALVAVIPASGSRTVAISVVSVLLAAFLGGLIRGTTSFSVRHLPEIVVGLLAMTVVSVGVLQIPLVQDAVTTFSTRWDQAAGEEGASTTLTERISSPFLDILETAASAPPFGKGIGAGSNFAASVLAGDSLALGEGSWERETNELGAIPGLIFLAVRSSFAIIMMVMAYRSLISGNILPWCLSPVVVVAVLMGGLDQPTAQGFLVMFSGVFLAALRGDPTNGTSDASSRMSPNQTKAV